MIENLWQSGLCETVEFVSGNDKSYFTRVPGGWIFSDALCSGVFIPYSEEFNPVTTAQVANVGGHFSQGDIGLVGFKDKLLDPERKDSLGSGSIDNATPKEWDELARDLYGG